jgi:hypothetical protein
MSDSISTVSSAMVGGSIQVQRKAQDLQKLLAEQLLPPPPQQIRADTASFSPEALARLASEQEGQA